MTSLASHLGRVTFDPSTVPRVNLPLPDTLTGVEVEVDRDGTRTTVMPVTYSPEWQEKHDGSLQNGREYVLAGPLSGQPLVAAVYKLYSNGTRVNRTYTGSTHIHLNVMDGFSAEALQALSLITYAFENVLYYVGDNSRQWCGYANRMTSAPHDVLEALLSDKFQFSRVRNAVSQSRYYGLNLQALSKYGTVEFRYFPTAESPEELLKWITLVQNIKRAAADLGNVHGVIAKLSTKEGYNDFVATYMSEVQEEVDAVSEYSRVKSLMSKALIIASAWEPERATEYDPERLGKRIPKLITVKKDKEKSVKLRPVYFEMVPTSRTHPPVSEMYARASAAGIPRESNPIVAMYYMDRLYIGAPYTDSHVEDWHYFNDMTVTHPHMLPDVINLAEAVVAELNRQRRVGQSAILADSIVRMRNSVGKARVGRPRNTKAYVARVRPELEEVPLPPVDGDDEDYDGFHDDEDEGYDGPDEEF